MDLITHGFLKNLDKAAWPKFNHQFDITCQQVKKRISQIKEKAKAYNLRESRRMQQNQTTSQAFYELDRFFINEMSEKKTSHKTLISNVNNFSPDNPHFYGREDVLNEIRDLLDHDLQIPELRSMTIWGTGGIKKTQVAIAYAKKKQKKDVKILLWINCKTDISRAESFAEIALLAGLDRASEDKHDHNRSEILKWLRRSSKSPCQVCTLCNADCWEATPWLVILDNVELYNPDRSSEDVRFFWPSGEYGSILVISRHKGVSFGLAAHSLELNKLLDEEGEAYLQKVLTRTSYSSEESLAACKLSRLLDELYLALYLMKTHISRKEKTIYIFIKNFETNYQKLYKLLKQKNLNLHYQHSLKICWEITFQSLEVEYINATRILSVIVFIASEDISENVFLPHNRDLLPADFNFCAQNEK